MVVLQNQHTAAARQVHHLARGRHAVADRRDQRDVRGIGADQRRRRTARAFVLLRHEIRVELPRLALAGDADAARLLNRERQRAPGGGIEKADVARDVEQIALARKHRDRQR